MTNIPIGILPSDNKTRAIHGYEGGKMSVHAKILTAVPVVCLDDLVRLGRFFDHLEH